MMQVQQIARIGRQLIDSIERVIVGKRGVITGAVATFLAEGHLLLQDVPGVGKTMLAKALARSVGGEFKRIQFTPDMLPSDVTGVTIYDPARGEFRFRSGPVFANIVLADEINRATPKTQCSLLECMEERQVTVDGRTHALPQPFLVIATENPVEFQGTFPLPESQLDRFMTRYWIGYPSHAVEKEIVQRQLLGHPVEDLQPVTDLASIRQMQAGVRRVHVGDEVQEQAVALVRETRERRQITLGASPRASIQLTRLAQAHAGPDGRDHAIPDDVKRAALPVLAHRLVMEPDAPLEGVTSETAGQEIRDNYRVPRRRP